MSFSSRLITSPFRPGVCCCVFGTGKEYVTLFYDGLEEEKPDWDWEHIWGTGSYAYRDGCLYLGITKESTAKEMSSAALEDEWQRSRWRYVGLEMRLRCSDDNKLRSKVGGGGRCFGFYTENLKNQLRFTCAEPAFTGLRAIAIVDGKATLDKEVTGIDIREWHTYTCLWEEGKGIFLIDGDAVARTDSPPGKPMSIFIYIANARVSGSLDDYRVSPIDIDFDAYIQVDHVRTFVDGERFREMDSQISGLLSGSQQLLGDLERKGGDIKVLRREHERARNDWRKDHFIYEESKTRLEAIIKIMEQHSEVESDIP